jgi:hypothetical protein
MIFVNGIIDQIGPEVTAFVFIFVQGICCFGKTARHGAYFSLFIYIKAKSIDT